MPNTPTPAPNVTAADLRVLLGLAGLTIAEDRAPAVLADLNAHLAHARHLDPLLADARPPDLAPYDPAFPKIAPEAEAE